MVAKGNTPRTVKITRNKKPAEDTTPVTQMESESASVANLSAYVPDPEIAKRYVPRKIHGVWDFDIAKEAARAGENILLMGDTGSGKTLFGEAVASHTRKIYYSLPCDVSIDPSALFGRMIPDEDGGIVWQDGPVTQVARGKCGLGGNCTDPKCDGAGVLNISEINFMPPKIAASTYPLLDHRRYIPLLAHHGEIVTLHPRTLIICDMNPQYRGTMELNAAFLNRFAHKIQWGYNEEVEEKLVKMPTTRALADQLRKMMGTEIQTPVSTNMLMEFEDFASRPAFGLEYAIANFVSAFQVGERKAVGNVAELKKSSWATELQWFKKKQELAEGNDEDAEIVVGDDDLEEVEFEFEDE